MKLITWNINGIRAITGQNPSRRFDVVTQENNLFDFIYAENPDLICVQETKAWVDQIEDRFKCPEGYLAFYHDCKVKKGYSGVATFTKREPLSVKTDIGIPKFDDEGRILQLEFPEFTHFNIYFPKGYTDDPRLDFKMEFYDALIDYIMPMLNSGKQIIISGDYNTAHKEIDLARPEENRNTSGFIPIEREKLDDLIEIGFIDSYREFEKEKGNYTWWSNRGGARQRNVGWRIDYNFVSLGIKEHLIGAKQYPEVLGSDHCPVGVELDF